MPQPQGAELEAIRARRAELKERYLVETAKRPVSTVQGVHHLALICRDVEETIRFYQELLGFPLVELVENRDHPDFTETIGGVQHLALSTSPEEFAAAKERLDAAGISYIGPDRGIDNSLYIRDPNGVGIEFYCERLGFFEGEPLLSS
jgi:glyoxylase I family protein